MAVGVATDDLADHVSQISVRVDAVKFAGFDQRRQDRPMLSAAIRACDNAFFRFKAIGRIERSTMLESNFDAPVVDEAPVNPSQRERA